MNAPLRKPWTQEEFFSWAERQETRYEFDGFQPVAMTGGSINHNRVMWGIHRALDRRIPRGKGPCEPLGPDAGVKTINNAVRYPDALVTCSKLEGKSHHVPGVVVIFEVLSPSSGQDDRILKVREYAAVPSIRRYIIAESSGIGLMVLERQSPDDPWKTTVLTTDDTLHLPEISIEIPVAEIYEGIDFTEQDSQEA
jgi:Uma2 family endonuclease